MRPCFMPTIRGPLQRCKGSGLNEWELCHFVTVCHVGTLHIDERYMLTLLVRSCESWSYTDYRSWHGPCTVSTGTAVAAP